MMVWQPVFGKPGECFIDVWDGRAAVARYCAGKQPGTVAGDEALNWLDLEVEAEEEVWALGSSLNCSGHYPCSAELAALARWPDREGVKEG